MRVCVSGFRQGGKSRSCYCLGFTARLERCIHWSSQVVSYFTRLRVVLQQLLLPLIIVLVLRLPEAMVSIGRFRPINFMLRCSPKNSKSSPKPKETEAPSEEQGEESETLKH